MARLCRLRLPLRRLCWQLESPPPCGRTCTAGRCLTGRGKSSQGTGPGFQSSSWGLSMGNVGFLTARRPVPSAHTAESKAALPLCNFRSHNIHYSSKQSQSPWDFKEGTQSPSPNRRSNSAEYKKQSWDGGHCYGDLWKIQSTTWTNSSKFRRKNKIFISPRTYAI